MTLFKRFGISIGKWYSDYKRLLFGLEFFTRFLESDFCCLIRTIRIYNGKPKMILIETSYFDRITESVKTCYLQNKGSKVRNLPGGCKITRTGK